MHPRNPQHTRPTNTPPRRLYLKSAPSISLSLLHTTIAPASIHGGLAEPLLESILESCSESDSTTYTNSPPPSISSRSTNHADENSDSSGVGSEVLLTCPTCSFIGTYTLTSEFTTPVCTACMRRFKKRERKERRNERVLTSFPRLLEDFGEVREMEDGVGDGESLMGKMWGGGKRERRGRGRKGSAGSEGERTLVGSGTWRSVFSI